MEIMKVDFCFVDMVFKIDEVEDYVFKKIFVCYKKEFVMFCFEDDVDLNEIIG